MLIYKQKPVGSEGFTLIELLVVISIIALLLSIILPALRKVKDQGKKVVCAANEKAILQALLIYASENDECAYPIGKAASGWYLGWDMVLSPYFSTDSGDSSKEYFVCPADNKPRGFVSDPVYNPYSLSSRLPRSYMINGSLRNYPDMGGSSTPEWYSNKSDKPTKTTQVQLTANTIWVFEQHIGEADENLGILKGQVGYEGCTQGTNYWDSTWWPPHVKGYDLTWTSGTVQRGDQHPSGGNWGWMDGHVGWARHLSPSQTNGLLEYASEGVSFFYHQLATSKQRQDSPYSPTPSTP